jgi:hypothetical protein
MVNIRKKHFYYVLVLLIVAFLAAFTFLLRPHMVVPIQKDAVEIAAITFLQKEDWTDHILQIDSRYVTREEVGLEPKCDDSVFYFQQLLMARDTCNPRATYWVVRVMGEQVRNKHTFNTVHFIRFNSHGDMVEAGTSGGRGRWENVFPPN